MLVTEEARPKVEERIDPAQELLTSFKRARSVIDELESQQLSLFGGLDVDEDTDDAQEGESAAE